VTPFNLAHPVDIQLSSLYSMTDFSERQTATVPVRSVEMAAKCYSGTHEKVARRLESIMEMYAGMSVKLLGRKYMSLAWRRGHTAQLNVKRTNDVACMIKSIVYITIVSQKKQQQ